MNYPKLKVSPVCEDICPLCYKYVNCKKYGVTANDLFKSAKDNSKPAFSDTSYIDEEDEQNKSKKEPVIEKTRDTEDSEKSQTTAATAAMSDKEDDMDPSDIFGSEIFSKDCEAPFKVNEENKHMILCAATHLYCVCAQRALCQKVVHKAVAEAQQQNPHTESTCTLVVDYGQNMELPVFNAEQPGSTYYYSPLNAYNLGCVNHAHIKNEDYQNPTEHMHAHVYHEGVGRKGGNIVCSLIMKTLKHMNMLRDNECGKELNIIFDNCSGQNKNNTVLTLVPYLVEMGYFKEVNFIFLVVGHTKNAADRLFNALKKAYHHMNLHVMRELIDTLSQSESVTVHEATQSDFLTGMLI